MESDNIFEIRIVEIVLIAYLELNQRGNKLIKQQTNLRRLFLVLSRVFAFRKGSKKPQADVTEIIVAVENFQK